MLTLLLSAAFAAPEPSVTIAYDKANYVEYWATARRPSVELAGTLRFHPGIEATAGLRRLLTTSVVSGTAFDLFVAGRLAPEVLGGARWRWTPSVGLELGLTGALRRDWPVLTDSAWNVGHQPWAGDDMIYASALLDPLRGAIGPVTFSLGTFSLGSTLPSWGEDVRFSLTRVRLGVRW